MVYRKERVIIKVNRVEQQFIHKSHPLYEIVDRHCFYSKNVYNQANYIIRQAFTKENEIIKANDIQKLMQGMDCYKECGSQAAQKTIQMVDKVWKSFFKAKQRLFKASRKISWKTKDSKIFR